MSSRDVTTRGPEESTVRSSADGSCPECDGPIRERLGETCCDDCGLVVAEDWLDRGPEWRLDGTAHENGKRVGPPLTEARHDRGLSTEIGWDHVDSGRKRGQINRFRRHHNRAKFESKADRNLAYAFGEIARMTSALDLSYAVRERASAIYRAGQCMGLPLGRSIEVLAAGSVYAACRCAGLVRTLDEVASFTTCSKDEVEFGYRVLNRELELAAQVARPGEYVPKLTSAVDAPDRVVRRALELATQAEADGLANGRHPGGVAAACVYIAGHESGQLYTQRELSEIVGVTRTTLRTRYYELLPHVE